VLLQNSHYTFLNSILQRTLHQCRLWLPHIIRQHMDFIWNLRKLSLTALVFLYIRVYWRYLALLSA